MGRSVGTTATFDARAPGAARETESRALEVEHPRDGGHAWARFLRTRGAESTPGHGFLRTRAPTVPTGSRRPLKES